MSEPNSSAATPVVAAPLVPPPAPPPQAVEPSFLETIRNAYYQSGKRVIVLPGNTKDLFFCKQTGTYLPLEQVLYQALSGGFILTRLDHSSGLSFYDRKDEATLKKLCGKADKLLVADEEKLGELGPMLKLGRNSPLPAITLLKDVVLSATRVQEVQKGQPQGERSPAAEKTVCCLLKFAGSVFPAGDWDKLGEVERARLITFLNLIESPEFNASKNLIILIADTASELNARIVGLPTVQTVEIELPDTETRAHYVSQFKPDEGAQTPVFEKSAEVFINDSAGFTLTAARQMLGASARSRKPITRKDVLSEINRLMKADLGDQITFSMPEHRVADIVGYANTGEIFIKVFKRCDNRKTAVSAILVAGPNGSGKTYQLEAYAAESGRVVIELTGLRGMYFGQTDQFFEKLRLRLKTYGKILIIVDEADTQFGDLMSKDTHEVEKRLTGNLIKMMGDPAMRGKVLWALATSRPQKLPPDIRRRCPVQIPIFDLEGEERKQFVRELFKRKSVELIEDELPAVIAKTQTYSASNYGDLVTEVLSGGLSAKETLEVWQASAAIKAQRDLQAMEAALHCSYPALLPEKFRDKVGTEEFERDMRRLKLALSAD